ncbi:lamin tail domain-containing protein [Marinomonas pontica]|uniref:lamin tail domain-containing protein n=1 Tax=Marinomonas pontica TaxID=264739 RepID=UPI0022445445|nr:lamin tail domain-containing protein [Marinomonas pontica]MCW8356915.1 lamin tail domain-containing protein [Marinomonas pontica]MDP5057782.1 lamin tail domain-containing protein [Marinomonas hwangdonensis]
MYQTYRSIKPYLFTGFMAVTAVVAFALHQTTVTAAANQLFISEVSFANNDKQDWIELYNPSLNSVSLKGYYLSDDLDDPERFRIPFDVIVPAHGTALLHGEKAENLPMNAIKLNFSLGNGETVTLTSPSGKTQLDRIALIAPASYKGQFSIGHKIKNPDIVEISYQPTPGQLVGVTAR